MSWWRASLEVPGEMAEAVAWLLAERTAAEVTELQDDTTMIRGATDAVRVVIGFSAPPPEDFPAQVAECLSALGLPHAPVQTSREDDDSWREGWKAFFHRLRMTDRISVRPPWEDPDPEAQVDIQIDPGMAFGTGSHATTLGVMKALDAFVGDGPSRRVLDVGSGSAILSIGLAKLGHTVVGVEIDREAMTNARENVARNEVQDRVTLVHGSVELVEARFALVVANIIAPVLIEIAPGIMARATQDLFLTGLLVPQEAAVLSAFHEFEPVDRWLEGDWVVLQLRRR